jgi:hypothetical protein
MVELARATLLNGQEIVSVAVDLLDAHHRSIDRQNIGSAVEITKFETQYFIN